MRLLELLGEHERTVGELQEALELDSSGASQHLAALRRQGLLERLEARLGAAGTGGAHVPRG